MDPAIILSVSGIRRMLIAGDKVVSVMICLSV
jgi:hypothetical protein